MHTLKFAFGALLLLAPTASAGIIVYNASLNGLSESPPNASLGTGFAIVTINNIVNTMEVNVTFSGLTGTSTASHIHCCTAVPDLGTAGVATTTPTFPSFPLGVTAGSYDMTFDLTLSSSYNSAFVTAQGGTVAAAESTLLSAMAGGETYLNIHSTSVPGGEIRGFLAPQVPEPGTIALMAFGLTALAIVRRRRGRLVPGQ